MTRAEGRGHQSPQAHRSGSADAKSTAPKKPPSERIRALWPDIWALIKPRRGLLALGLLLIIINRVSGLVLPASTRYLIDDIIGKRHASLLLPLLSKTVVLTPTSLWTVLTVYLRGI